MWWKHGFLKATWENYGSPLHDPGALAVEVSKALLCRNRKRVVFQLKGTEVGEWESFQEAESPNASSAAGWVNSPIIMVVAQDLDLLFTSHH